MTPATHWRRYTTTLRNKKKNADQMKVGILFYLKSINTEAAIS